MRFRTNLRSRVTLAFALLGLVVSLGVAGSLYVLTIDMEERLIAETLSAELEDYISRYKIDPRTLPPTSTTIRTYVVLPDTQNIPTVLRDLKAGLHKVIIEGRDYYAEVRVDGDQHFVVLFDDAQIRHREYQSRIFLGIGILVMTLMSALLGHWLARRVIAPVVELATRVSSFHPEDQVASLAIDFPHDEVGTLAHEFDQYLQRLSAFIKREQAFTADVSHELRTPLTVISGASDVLLDDSELDDAKRKRVERIARSAREMSELVEVLMLLAREEKPDVSLVGCSVADVLQQVIEGHQHLLSHKSVDIKLDIQAKKILPVECALLRIVLANLVRNAISYTEHGHISIYLDEEGVLVKDTGIGIPKEQIQRIFDRYYTSSTGGVGIGLSLVKRICQLYGWEINIESDESAGTTVRLSFKG